LKGRRRVGGRIAAGLALAVMMASPALAQYDDEPLPAWYLGPLAGYAFADGDRGARDGMNLHLVAGRVIYDALAIELNAFGTRLDSEFAGGPDTDLTGAGLDLALGLPAGGHPVFLLGAGAVQHDVGGESKTQTFGNLGLGYYLPFSFGGELWRLEVRYHLVTGEHPALPGEDLVEDVRVNFGVLFGFGGEGPAQAPAAAPAPAESRPPPPEPQAAPEAAPEPAPEPPAEPAVAPAPPLAPVATDADGDGVADADDACPGTAPGTNVDARGCLDPESVVVRSAYFPSSSSSLTATAYVLLREVAAALKADPSMRLEVEGHSDMSGPADRNLPLSQQRAEVVRRFLIDLGIDPARLVARGYGETRPVNDNKTLEKRAYNRRVQFRRLEGPAP